MIYLSSVLKTDFESASQINQRWNQRLILGHLIFGKTTKYKLYEGRDTCLLCSQQNPKCVELGHGRDSIIFWMKEWNIRTMNIRMCQSTEKELRVSFPFTVMCCATAVQNQKAWEHVCYFVFLHLIRQEVPLFQWENGTETATLKMQHVWNTRLITDVLENDKPLGLN